MAHSRRMHAEYTFFLKLIILFPPWLSSSRQTCQWGAWCRSLSPWAAPGRARGWGPACAGVTLPGDPASWRLDWGPPWARGWACLSPSSDVTNTLTLYLGADMRWVTACSKIKLDTSEWSERSHLPGSERPSWPLWPMREPGAEPGDQSGHGVSLQAGKALSHIGPGLCHHCNALSHSGTRTWWHQCQS